MQTGLKDEKFDELYEMYQSRQISELKLLFVLFGYEKNYNRTIDDFELIVERSIKKNELEYVQELTNASKK